MGVAQYAKKAVRSGLFQLPRVYEAVTSERRYLLLHRFGKVHESAFKALPGLLGTDDPLVLDVGANSGQSVLSIMTVLPRARIVSFEPNPLHRASLSRLQSRFSELRVEPVGLSDKTGTAELYVPRYNGKRMTGLASFDYASAAGWISPETVFGFRPNLLQVEQHALQLRRLDEYDLAPDFIKVDVQGLEEQVVAGGLETIRRYRPHLLMESPTPSLLQQLTALGYRACEYVDGRLQPMAGKDCNVLFVPT